MTDPLSRTRPVKVPQWACSLPLLGRKRHPLPSPQRQMLAPTRLHSDFWSALYFAQKKSKLELCGVLNSSLKEVHRRKKNEALNGIAEEGAAQTQPER